MGDVLLTEKLYLAGDAVLAIATGTDTLLLNEGVYLALQETTIAGGFDFDDGSVALCWASSA